MDEARLKRMQDLAGEQEGGRAPKLDLPLIKFDGNTGRFSYRDLDKNESEIESPIGVVIVKNRKRLESFNDGLSTNDYTSPSQVVTLFQRNDDGKYTRLATGKATDLRQQYPTLKTQEILYVVYNGELCKLTVKGTSSSAFYEYRDVLKAENKHSFMVTTMLSSEDFKGSKIKKTFYNIGFTSAELTQDNAELDFIEESMTKVSEYVKASDKFQADKLLSQESDHGGNNKLISNSTVPNALTGSATAKTKTALEEFEDDEDAINPEEINF